MPMPMCSCAYLGWKSWDHLEEGMEYGPVWCLFVRLSFWKGALRTSGHDSLCLFVACEHFAVQADLEEILIKWFSSWVAFFCCSPIHAEKRRQKTGDTLKTIKLE